MITSSLTIAPKPAVEVNNLAKHYGDVVALRSVDLTINAGEYFVLLGPSGGGKTTLLRTIGGFHKPTSGTVKLHGRDVGHLPPDKRPTSMVFQSYALFPHMSVLGNVGYGLSISGLGKKEVLEKSMSMLDVVGLQGYENRKPHELSGGQQQRVQLARALVLDRDILLLDEPLAALDAQLRKDMCLELKHLQEKVGITFIHVTHNQEEAMTVADRIALIADGDLVEAGAAREIYCAPEKSFTASFVGENNMLGGFVRKTNKATTEIGLGDEAISTLTRNSIVKKGDNVSLSIRSELVKIAQSKGPKPKHSLDATYIESVYLGLTTTHLFELGTGEKMMARTIADSDERVLKAGEKVRLTWRDGDLRLHQS